MTDSHKQKLLLTRKTVQELFDGTSLDTLMELERRGILTPIRLTGKPTSQVYYSATEVEAIVQTNKVRERIRVAAEGEGE